MKAQRTFIALACATLLTACGGASNGDSNGGDSTAIAPSAAPAAPAPIAPAATDTTMAGHAMGADTAMHDSMAGMAHDSMMHDTTKK